MQGGKKWRPGPDGWESRRRPPGVAAQSGGGSNCVEGPKKEANKKKKEERAQKAKAKGLTITRTNRNKRKTITNVAGLEHFPDVDVKEASKLLGKKFACGASVTKGATGKDEIDIQGDFSHEVATFMTEKFDVDAELIKLVDKGK